MFQGAGAQPGAERQQLPAADGCREEENAECPGGDPQSAGRAAASDQQTQSQCAQKNPKENENVFVRVTHTG